MNIVIFGTGLFYQRRKQVLPNDTTIIAFLDNNKELVGTYQDNTIILPPEEILRLEYDSIVLASSVPNDMRKQLIELGVSNDKILYWEEFVSIHSHGIIERYGECISISRRKKLLIIVPIINYAGGFMAAYNFGLVMKEKGFDVVITSPVADERVICDIINRGINVWICPALPYISCIEMEWISEFDYILCNSLQTIICATNIRKGKRILFWIHEHSQQYEDILAQYSEYCDFNELGKINVYAVSSLAKSILQKHLTKYSTSIGVLPFGIYDSNSFSVTSDNQGKVTFALIGSISPLKNQLFFIKAFKNLPANIQSKINCKIIGRDFKQFYREEVNKEAENCSFIEICGEKTQEQVRKMLKESIDVVVCTSTEETMSMTIVEGLMESKICLTNDNTGVAHYIEDGINGFVYRCNNQKNFEEQIIYIVKNYKNMDKIRVNARDTYQRTFSLNALSERINDIWSI